VIRRAALAVAAALCGLPAMALPPDARIALQSAKPRIEKVDAGFTAVEVDAPEVLRAELLPAGELLLEPRKPGLARVFLFAPRIVRVIEVAVDLALPRSEDRPPPPGCAAGEEARIASAACYEHWRGRLRHSLGAPPLVFEEAGLFAQLKAAQVELDAAGLNVKVAVSPFGVRVKGAKDDTERRRALRAIWSALLGPLRIDG
jgi:hypothetical protein